MSKFLQGVMISFMIALLCYSFVPRVFASSSTVLGSENGAPQDEIDADSALASLIADYSSTAGYSAYNWYGAQTTASNIYTAAAGNGAPYASGVPRSTTFYIGHGGATTFPSMAPPFYCKQYWITDNDGGLVYDANIFGYSSAMESNLVVLWSCNTGDVIGGTNWYSLLPPASLAYGMPYAWLHTTSLNSDGYANPDTSNVCFIGFHEAAPWLTDPTVSALSSFITDFYRAALELGDSVNQALDWASQNYCSLDFSDCWLYTGYLSPEGVWSYMVVYGNGNIHLTPVNPLVAMKTMTDGRFYVPNATFVNTTFLKVEMLFGNANLTGDQTGGTSPYPTNYPNNVVSGMDVSFVSSKFGSWEGETSPIVWDYMADVNPDRKISGEDVALASKYFGKSGTYITDLAGVAITFNTGQTVSPGSDGFVTIPPGATSFNVTRNGTPKGAMIIFWGP